MSINAQFSRRHWIRSTSALAAGASCSSWMSRLAAAAAAQPQRQRSCILLWMSGGPSQLDTFDLKPGTDNGGPFAEIKTATPGIGISEHLPQVAKRTGDLAIIRSVQSKEGDHGRATAHLHTGYLPQASIRFPSLGSLVSHELADTSADLPGFVSIAPRGAFAQPSVAAGFLGPRHAPLVVAGGGDSGPGNLRVEDLTSPDVPTDRWHRRVGLLHELEQPFLATRPGPGSASHVTAYDRAARLRRPEAMEAFNLHAEPNALRDQYGRSDFGQGCLLARRLVERGVPFVEVTLGGWDTHNDNFDQVRALSNTLDPAWGTLMSDLAERGLLEDTLIVWMGEFGRTPGINPRQGRDHYPAAWSAVLGGGGVHGGQVVGRTSASGLAVEERPVTVPDLMATLFQSLGLDPARQNISNVARPIRLADPAGEAIREVIS